MHERLEKIKQHVKDNKVTYIACGATAVVAGTAVYVAVKMGALHTDVDVNVDKYNFKWKSPTTNNVFTVVLDALGDPGNPVRDLETGAIYASQGQAARALGLSASLVSKHLNGLIETAGGHRLERLLQEA